MRALVKRVIPKKIFELIEPFGHLAEAVFAQMIYGFPARKMKVIGVTGTDGKTTTATLIFWVLKAAGYKAGLLTTISIDFGEGLKPNPTRLTTVSAMEMGGILREMRGKGVEWLVLETTSHALAQYRIWGIPYYLAVMTNVTHEHLDYHKTFERYREAKLKLFKLATKNKKGLMAGIVNAEDSSAELFTSSVRKSVSYGIDRGELRAKDIVATESESRFKATYKDKEISITINIPGRFNIYNALAAVGAGLAIGIDSEVIVRGISSVKSVEGRMNAVDLGQDFTVIVDYAHTPESFEKIFGELKPLTKGRLISVFGSAGERDQAKRAIQGEVAGRYCDIVVVTEEDDRREDGSKIMEEIAKGASRSGKVKGRDLFLIHDRAEAINFVVQKAKENDTVVALGKGHEKSIIGPEGKREWNEIAAVEAALKEKFDES